MCASNLLAFAACTDHLDGTGITAEFETAIKELTHFRYVLSMSSASSTLDFAYESVGLCSGDEVIVPSFTAGETIAPLLRRGCVVVFADVQPATLTIDPEAAPRLVTPKTKGIIGVDIAGWPHDTAAIRAIADEHHLVYVADLAQGFGARIDGQHSGYAADAAVLSLNAQKQLQAGEGGLLLTNDTALYQHLLRATQHPHRQARELGSDQVNFFPVNGRFSALAAAAALHNLPPAINRIHQQRHHARAVIELLNATGLTETIAIPPASEPTFPYLTASWRAAPQPVALLETLHHAGFPMRLRSLPVRPLHTLPMPSTHYRIPTPLTKTAAVHDRCFCLEAAW